eukprot:scaffold67432_cov18-Tisochrysis_lutea.AAC.1
MLPTPTCTCNCNRRESAAQSRHLRCHPCGCCCHRGHGTCPHAAAVARGQARGACGATTRAA